MRTSTKNFWTLVVPLTLLCSCFATNTTASIPPKGVKLFEIPNLGGVEARGVAYNQAGELFVADLGPSSFGKDRILKYDRCGNLLFIFGEGKLARPQGITVNLDGQIIVADSITGQSNDPIVVFDAKGQFLFQFVAGFTVPVSVATNQQGWIYVAGFDDGDIRVFDRCGNFLFEFNFAPTANNLDTSSVTVNDKGQVIVTNQGLKKAFVFDAKGTKIFEFSTNVGGNTDGPTAVTVNEAGEILIRVDTKVLVFDSCGDFLLSFGNLSPGDHGIAVNADGEIAVSQKGANAKPAVVFE